MIVKLIQGTLKDMLAHVKQARIAPSTITAPPPNFVPPSLGVGIPIAVSDEEAKVSKKIHRGLQEERVERDAWKGIFSSLQKLAEKQALPGPTQDSDTTMVETQ